MLFKKKISQFVHFYETKVAPSFFFTIIYWPLYKICKLKKICFVVNIASGVGHTTAEIDFFLRKKFLKIVSKNKKFVIVRKPDQYSFAINLFYKKHFYKVFIGRFWFWFFFPLTIHYKDITEDCGLSRLKWQIGNNRAKIKYPDNYLYQISKEKGMARLSYYYQLCSSSPSYFPLKEIDLRPSERLPFLDKKKTALIQIKNKIVNATAAPTDPRTLLPSLYFLKKNAYQLIFIGREKIPSCFLDFEIFNYAESEFANYTNDILLFLSASIAITSGSGISFLADRLNIPYLYLNSWQLQMSMPSKNAIMIPAIAVEKNSKKEMKFLDQINLYASREDIGHELFPANLFDVRNANKEEILMALKELLERPKEDTNLQKKYHSLLPNSPLEHGLSRCSHFFLTVHEELF